MSGAPKKFLSVPGTLGCPLRSRTAQPGIFRMLKRIVIGTGLLGIACLLAFLALAWWPVIAPIDPPASTNFPPELIAKGEVLAGAGYCATCHTAKGGATYAGGYGMPTPSASSIRATSHLILRPESAAGPRRHLHARCTKASPAMAR